MDELDQLLEELERVEACETVLDSHLQTNANCHCDLFETCFYKEFWHSFQSSNQSLVGSSLEQLVASLQP
ncbi:MAG: hypothetical protein ACOYXC_06900 [Candidatus Rifleibacteriota bacterium]